MIMALADFDGVKSIVPLEDEVDLSKFSQRVSLAESTESPTEHTNSKTLRWDPSVFQTKFSQRSSLSESNSSPTEQRNSKTLRWDPSVPQTRQPRLSYSGAINRQTTSFRGAVPRRSESFGAEKSALRRSFVDEFLHSIRKTIRETRSSGSMPKLSKSKQKGGSGKERSRQAVMQIGQATAGALVQGLITKSEASLVMWINVPDYEHRLVSIDEVVKLAHKYVHMGIRMRTIDSKLGVEERNGIKPIYSALNDLEDDDTQGDVDEDLIDWEQRSLRLSRESVFDRLTVGTANTEECLLLDFRQSDDEEDESLERGSCRRQDDLKQSQNRSRSNESQKQGRGLFDEDGHWQEETPPPPDQSKIPRSPSRTPFDRLPDVVKSAARHVESGMRKMLSKKTPELRRRHSSVDLRFHNRILDMPSTLQPNGASSCGHGGLTITDNGKGRKKSESLPTPSEWLSSTGHPFFCNAAFQQTDSVDHSFTLSVGRQPSVKQSRAAEQELEGAHDKEEEKPGYRSRFGSEPVGASFSFRTLKALKDLKIRPSLKSVKGSEAGKKSGSRSFSKSSFSKFAASFQRTKSSRSQKRKGSNSEKSLPGQTNAPPDQLSPTSTGTLISMEETGQAVPKKVSEEDPLLRTDDSFSSDRQRRLNSYEDTHFGFCSPMNKNTSVFDDPDLLYSAEQLGFRPYVRLSSVVEFEGLR